MREFFTRGDLEYGRAAGGIEDETGILVNAHLELDPALEAERLEWQRQNPNSRGLHMKFYRRRWVIAGADERYDDPLTPEGLKEVEAKMEVLLDCLALLGLPILEV